jgi:hypothetical protein
VDGEGETCRTISWHDKHASRFLLLLVNPKAICTASVWICNHKAPICTTSRSCQFGFLRTVIHKNGSWSTMWALRNYLVCWVAQSMTLILWPFIHITIW